MDWGSRASDRRNDHPHGVVAMTEIELFRSQRNKPLCRTVVEQLDAAETGEEFGNVILGLFKKLETLEEGHEDG